MIVLAYSWQKLAFELSEQPMVVQFPHPISFLWRVVAWDKESLIRSALPSSPKCRESEVSEWLPVKQLTACPNFQPLGEKAQNENKTRHLTETELQPGHTQSMFLTSGSWKQEQLRDWTLCLVFFEEAYLYLSRDFSLSWSQWKVSWKMTQ